MRKILLIFIIGSAFSFSIFSQTKEEKKEFKEKFLEAEYFFLIDEFEEAAFLYKDLLNSDPDNANLQFLVGAAYLSVPGKKKLSIPYLEKAVQHISPSYREGSYKERNAPKECLFALAKAYHVNNDLDLAEEYYNKFKEVMQLRDVAEIEFINKQVKSIELSKNMIKDTVKLIINPLIENYELEEVSRYNAVYCEDKSMLIYLSDRPFYSAILMTFFMEGQWTKPELINNQVQVDGKIRLCSVSFDGKELFISRKENYNSELFMSEFKNGKWQAAKPLPDNINTIFNETHAMLTKGKNTMYFTSDKPGGYGAMDIYKTNRKEGGEWGIAENLGKPINSTYSEETPFITEDGKTIYFSSMSHATMGGFDIFYSTKLPDGKWSYPANLGFPISSNDDDLHYQPINNGLQAVFNGNSDFFNPNDVAMMSPAEADIKKLVQIKGKVIPTDAGILAADTKVDLVSSSTKEVLATVTPNPETGEYTFDVPAGDYTINVESVGYDTLRDEVSILPQHSAGELTMESSLIPEDVGSGEYVVAKNLLFGFDSYALSEESKFELEKMYKIMSENPEMLLELTGHTDSIGSLEYNLRLSNNRSKAISNYLISRGISEDRFISKGVGEEGNIAINTLSEGRKYNRQVELKLVNSGEKKIWLEEYMVPEHLKPEAQKNYYVVLADGSDAIDDLKADFANRDIKLYETGRKHIYAAGSFSNKRKAIEYLNEAIEVDFPEGRIVNEDEFNYLLQPSVPDLDKVKGPFTIQLLALRSPIVLDQFIEQDKIRQIQSSDGFYRYISGVYDQYNIAQDSLVKFVLRGYTDSYIIPLSRFDKSLGENEIIPENYDFYFTIQFSATKRPAGEDFFRDIEEIVTNKGKDGYYRYSSGIYLNKLEAEKTLMLIKEKGYKDAFIKKVSRY